jgi:hypothetical protein
MAKTNGEPGTFRSTFAGRVLTPGQDVFHLNQNIKPALQPV